MRYAASESASSFLHRLISTQETDAALLRSHHEIEKLQSELVTLAQTKRRLRETYDEKRQRILLLQGAERQMRLDIAVFSVRIATLASVSAVFFFHFIDIAQEYNQRMLAVARFEQQKRQKFEGPQSLAGDTQITVCFSTPHFTLLNYHALKDNQLRYFQVLG